MTVQLAYAIKIGSDFYRVDYGSHERNGFQTHKFTSLVSDAVLNTWEYAEREYNKIKAHNPSANVQIAIVEVIHRINFIGISSATQ